ncbi:AMP-binding protein [Streptomyces sp. TRM43335]|uniref:AMP-binding protein n=1 Tax=Streptomyces taklimakanensis TaxID=2569853 RepID=A0A6G2B750_9ACTN|nr:AMP-binding protein [Streptomyces taklimakanensis]
MGIEQELLREDALLRAHLGLDSVDITQLEIEFSERLGTRVDLWGEHDHTLRQLADALDGNGRPSPRTSTLYRSRGWWRPDLLDELVLDARVRRVHREALVGDGRVLTRAELDAAVSGCAARLAHRGTRPGENVLVQLPNQPQFVVLVLALMRIGARPVLAPPALRDHELAPVLSSLRPAAMAVPARQRRFDHLRFAERLRERHPFVRNLLVSGGVDPARGHLDLDEFTSSEGTLPAADDHRRPSDVALFLLSSGTTGAPKPIPRTHEAFGHVVRTSAAVSALTPDSVYLAAMPVAHSFGFGHPGILGALAHGGKVVLGESGDPAGAMALIERERVTHCALTPAVARQWLTARAASHGLDLSSLEVLQVGGARLDEETARRLGDAFDCRIQQVYGASEGLLNFSRLDDPLDVVFTTQGRPVSPGDETRVVDGRDRPVADGETGELLARGPGVITAYHGDTDTASFTSDGFYRTGDLVRRHPSGNFVVIGRVKDVINRGGEKIPAGELEALVQKHPGVRAAAAVPMPHPVLGETVCLYVVDGGDGGDGSPTLREIRRFLEDGGLAPFKLPERVVRVSALPLTGTGKIDKARLREDVATRVAAEHDGRCPG